MHLFDLTTSQYPKCTNLDHEVRSHGPFTLAKVSIPREHLHARLIELIQMRDAGLKLLSNPRCDSDADRREVLLTLTWTKVVRLLRLAYWLDTVPLANPVTVETFMESVVSVSLHFPSQFLSSFLHLAKFQLPQVHGGHPAAQTPSHNPPCRRVSCAHRRLPPHDAPGCC